MHNFHDVTAVNGQNTMAPGQCKAMKMTSATKSGGEQQVFILHTLSISAAGEDRKGLARIRILGDGLAFLADCRQNLFHVNQMCFRRRSSRRRFPEDATKVDSDRPTKLPRRPPTCFSSCCTPRSREGSSRVTLGPARVGEAR